ncbi:hypothetical protein CORT_0F04190 [Candida orthopsilosis Co 90-125]|uniref:triacylglycerol lipase n=1 Tax=Candida orthopsilosis (strain 90-125) TaxID=1136231 RepID=H8X9H7_CANO9|nr:hypothetical protein CORT_0F04190 [Candida orthopsilosis Co 90-125]CCG24643.1 hypothetical protein CORT_0F04190 [Candida orthopsilosis Co 90-125]
MWYHSLHTPFLLAFINLSKIVCSHSLGDGIYLDMRENDVHPIDPEVYSNLYTYAHLVDIAYCISEIHGIDPPFKCDLNCEKRFPNMTLVYQWYFPESVTGYIATTYDNIFNYDIAGPRKMIIISLRGTRSIFDTYADMKVDMINYSNLGLNLPFCGRGCKVHNGFYKYFTTTLSNINEYIVKEIGDEDYELIIVGHSLGGSIALLLGLHYLDIGFDKLTLVTMGQPLTGNYDFVNWADRVLGSYNDLKHNEFKRKFLRVIHKNDVITTIPRSRNPFIQYHQFDNQIYLNCSTTNVRPRLNQVFDCVDGANQDCIAHDFPYLTLDRHDYLQAHITYFRRMGLCGIVK